MHGTSRYGMDSSCLVHPSSRTESQQSSRKTDRGRNDHLVKFPQCESPEQQFLMFAMLTTLGIQNAKHEIATMLDKTFDLVGSRCDGLLSMGFL